MAERGEAGPGGERVLALLGEIRQSVSRSETALAELASEVRELEARIRDLEDAVQKLARSERAREEPYTY